MIQMSHNFSDSEKISHHLKIFCCYHYFSKNRKVVREVKGHFLEIGGSGKSREKRKQTSTFSHSYVLFSYFIIFSSNVYLIPIFVLAVV